VINQHESNIACWMIFLRTRHRRLPYKPITLDAMRRCWGLTRNLQLCGRRGDWHLFCDEHRRQSLGWICFLVFTVLAGRASILSYVEQRRSTRNAQNQTMSAATPPDTLSTKPQESQPTPSPLLSTRSNPVTDEDSR
jgi:hypothetical protein